MRLLTFPGEVNGHKGAFRFGFGIETAGFCDIIYQHTHSNIPKLFDRLVVGVYASPDKTADKEAEIKKAKKKKSK